MIYKWQEEDGDGNVVWNKYESPNENHENVAEIIVEDAEEGIYTVVDDNDNKTTYNKDGEIVSVSFSYLNKLFGDMGLL